ncbi:MAG: hypothetical protein H9W81_13500 [Enterococcus sp.]|nr:hypothetical protein [Enterococcus sp.]
MSDKIAQVKEAMEAYWQDTATSAQSVADTISFQRQSVSDRDMNALIEFNAGLRAANNVLIEIRRESAIPLTDRLEKMLDAALCSGTAHIETARIYNNVLKVLMED